MNKESPQEILKILNLAKMYESKKNLVKAFELYKEAADYGDSLAFIQVAKMYAVGIGIGILACLKVAEISKYMKNL